MQKARVRKLIIGLSALAMCYLLIKLVQYSMGPPEGAGCFEQLPADVPLTTVDIPYPSDIPFAQKGGTINDMSCLNQTAVFGVVRVENEEDIKRALAFAKENNLTVSMSGARHSMGGQAFYKDGLVIDMRSFNKMFIHEDTQTLTVQSGATWHEIQHVIDQHGYAIRAMQSSDIFTIGGSISVNAHGMDHHTTTLAHSIVSLRVLFADGTIQHIDAQQDQELFRLIVGGYGLFGIILDATVRLTPNVMCKRSRTVVAIDDFLAYFNKHIKDNSQYELFYGHLSTGPVSFFKEILLYMYERDDAYQDDLPGLKETPFVQARRLTINVSKRGFFGRAFKWLAEKYLDVDAWYEPCPSGGEASCLVSRNEVMHDSVEYTRNILKYETDILHEYFIPQRIIAPFIKGISEILKKHKANVLNASVRVVKKQDIFLNYAPEDMFSLVLYLNQKISPQANDQMRRLTEDLIAFTLKMGGTFFLPYQLNYSKKQLKRAYPMIDRFFKQKRRYDPELRFMNAFYAKYA